MTVSEIKPSLTFDITDPKGQSLIDDLSTADREKLTSAILAHYISGRYAIVLIEPDGAMSDNNWANDIVPNFFSISLPIVSVVFAPTEGLLSRIQSLCARSSSVYQTFTGSLSID